MVYRDHRGSCRSCREVWEGGGLGQTIGGGGGGGEDVTAKVAMEIGMRGLKVTLLLSQSNMLKNCSSFMPRCMISMCQGDSSSPKVL